MEEEFDKIKREIKDGWKDDYFILLGIYQHLEECKQKYDMVKNNKILNLNKEDAQFELDKELADLKILLDLYVKDEMVEKRLIKFRDSLKK
jgi:hypothetical protein